MSELESDLKTTTESIRADASRLEAIEAEKLQLDPGDPRMLALSNEAEHLARRILPETVAQSELAAEAAADPR
jgi:hypothetical protein